MKRLTAVARGAPVGTQRARKRLRRRGSILGIVSLAALARASRSHAVPWGRPDQSKWNTAAATTVVHKPFLSPSAVWTTARVETIWPLMR